MSLTPAEAQSALNDIEKTENRTAASQYHRVSSPYLILWGVIWVIGYTVSAAFQEMSIVWMPLIVVGVVSSILLARRAPNARTAEFGWRYGASFAVIGIFNTALVAVMSPLDYNQMSALIPLAVGVYYAFIGIWTKAWRMMPLGLALIGLTTLGYFMLPEYFRYWMAAVGGGGLIVGGLWMRNAGS